MACSCKGTIYSVCRAGVRFIVGVIVENLLSLCSNRLFLRPPPNRHLHLPLSCANLACCHSSWLCSKMSSSQKSWFRLFKFESAHASPQRYPLCRRQCPGLGLNARNQFRGVITCRRFKAKQLPVHPSTAGVHLAISKRLRQITAWNRPNQWDVVA